MADEAVEPPGRARARAPRPRPSPSPDPATATGRIADAVRRRFPTRCSTGCAATGAAVSVDPAQRAEASRDWWPLAMTWAAEGQVAAAGRAPSCAPDDADAGRRGAAASATRPASRSPPPAGRSGVCGGIGPGATAAWCSTCAGSPASGRSTRRPRRRRAGRHLRRPLRARAAQPTHGLTVGHWPQSIDAVHRRRLARLPRRRPALQPLRQDRGHRASASTSCWPTAPSVHTGGHARQAVGPRPHPALRRLRGHARRHHRRPPAGLARCPPARAPGGVRLRHLRRRAPTPAAASSSAAPPPPSCASTTRSRPTAATAPATWPCCSCSTRATPCVVDAAIGDRRRGVRAGAERLDADLVEQWLGHRNDVSALEALISQGYVVDTMEITGTVVAARRHLRGGPRRHRRRARHARRRRPTSRTATPTAPASTSPSPASRRGHARATRRPLPSAAGTPAPAPCSPTAARSATTTASA